MVDSYLDSDRNKDFHRGPGQYVIDYTERIWDIISRHLSEDLCTHSIHDIVKELFQK
ncbi:MAG TPA: hypothetical protein VF220_10685 [Nitrososphaeraceae archaeon]